MQLPSDLPRPTQERLRTLLEVDLAVLDIAGLLAENWNAQAALQGVSGAQIKVLLCLHRDDSVAMNEVASRVGYDASNLTTLVERLRQLGLLERSEDPADRRRKTLRLTSAGLAVRDAFWTSLTSGSTPLAGRSHADLKRLAHLLRTEPRR